MPNHPLISVVVSPEPHGQWKAQIEDESLDLHWSGWSDDREVVIRMAVEYLIGVRAPHDFVVVSA